MDWLYVWCFNFLTGDITFTIVSTSTIMLMSEELTVSDSLGHRKYLNYTQTSCSHRFDPQRCELGENLANCYL